MRLAANVILRGLLWSGFRGGPLGGDTKMRQAAEEREITASRGFGHCIDSYGSNICLAIRITDRFRGSPYEFG